MFLLVKLVLAYLTVIPKQRLFSIAELARSLQKFYKISMDSMNIVVLTLYSIIKVFECFLRVF